MPDVVILTLSGFPDIFHQFVCNIKAIEPTWKVIVITSGEASKYLCPYSGMAGREPFSFPRNVNLGLRMSGRSDVLLMNDDVQFLAPGSVAKLAEIAHSDPKIGVLSPQFMGLTPHAPQTGNRLQNAGQSKLKGLTFSEERLCFTCIYLKRSMLDVVGEMDERFDGYGSDDDDFCRRVKLAGWKLAVTPEVIVRHGFGNVEYSASFRRTRPDIKGGSDPEMRRRYLEKWGDCK